MQGIKLNIDDDISLWIEGYYEKGEPENNILSTFTIETVESLFKDILPFIEWVSFRKNDYLDDLQDLVLVEYESQL